MGGLPSPSPQHSQKAGLLRRGLPERAELNSAGLQASSSLPLCLPCASNSNSRPKPILFSLSYLSDGTYNATFRLLHVASKALHKLAFAHLSVPVPCWPPRPMPCTAASQCCSLLA